jgi:ATP-binding cassette subfamily B protein
MIGLGWVLMLFQQGRVSMARIEEILAVEPAILDPESPVAAREIDGRVEFRDLTFRYDGAPRPALRSVSATVEAGRTLGILGGVGSGKSTLLMLVPRLYDPPPGTVLVDGRDVRDLPLDLLRARIGAVPQETYLFSESIRENIELGVPEGSEAPPGLVEDCARRAGVARDISEIPGGYEAMLGERGVNLSGGQKQRVAIARALARRPAILLLDDCLSSVDTETEKEILTNLLDVTSGCSTLVVSHRVSTVMHADEIVVLRDGEVEERGVHSELLARGGHYAELYERQQVEGVGGP